MSDIRKFFGVGPSKTSSKSPIKAKDSTLPSTTKKKDPSPGKAKKSSDRQPAAKKKSHVKSKKIEHEELNIISDTDSDDFTALKNVTSKAKKSKSEKTQLAEESFKDDQNMKNSKPKKTKKLSQEDEEEINLDLNENKRKKQSKVKRSAVIYDSDTEEEEPIPVKQRGSKRKSRVSLSESDDEKSKDPRIMSAFNKAVHRNKSKSPTKPAPTTKTISVSDFFGVQAVQRSDTKTRGVVKRRVDDAPVKTSTENIIIDDDDDEDFEETLRLLDEKQHQQPAKRVKLDEEETTTVTNTGEQTLASKLAAQKRHFVADTPDKPRPQLHRDNGHEMKQRDAAVTKTPTKPTPSKVSPAKTTPSKVTPTKSSPVKTTPAPAASGKTSTSTPSGDKGASYRSYMQREGPQALGSKEIPQGAENCLEGLTFVVTGVMESLERDEVKSLVERHGGKVTTNISKKTSYVVVGRDAGQSKLAKAASFKTKQLDEDGLLELVRTAPGKKSKYVKAAEAEVAQTEKLLPKDPTPSESKMAVSPVKETNSQSAHTTQNSSSSNNQSAALSQNTSTKSHSGEALLWVDKHKPQSLKQVIGQQGDKSNARKLLHWLTHWHKNIAAGRKPSFGRFNDDGGGYKAALLSGPPGVGKTTTTQLVCKEAGFSHVELNASDTRSKRSLKEEVAEALNNHTLVDFFDKSERSGADGQRHCLVMDEVDGMAGNEDRGGMQQLIQLIKLSRIPIICMCNDRNHQKVRSLANHCFDLRFQRPRVEQIKAAMMTLAYKEGLKVPPPALNEIILAANQDVRQIIHNLSMWTADDKSLTYEQAKRDSAKAKKDMKLGPFDVCRKVFVGGEETAHMTINDKSDLFFNDYSFGPLFVQENYISCTPYMARGDVRRHLVLLSQAADSIAQGDLVDRMIRREQNWNLLPVQAIFASVIPGDTMRGGLGQMIQFPAWLGKNSTCNKVDRITQELRNHMALNVSGDKQALTLDYLPHLRTSLTQPLVNLGSDGVGSAVDQLTQYDLNREDFDGLLEVTTWPHSTDPMKNVETKVKAAFTRTFNKSGHMMPYAGGGTSRRRGGGGKGEELGLEEGEEPGAVDSEPEEDDSVETDSMVKQKKKSTAATSKAKVTPAQSSSKGKGRGKGRK